MKIKVKAIPPNFKKIDRFTCGSESWARVQRKIFLRYNAGQYDTTKVNPDDVVIYFNNDNKSWEVWIKGNVNRI
jgi:hypothetical protein